MRPPLLPRRPGPLVLVLAAVPALLAAGCGAPSEVPTGRSIVLVSVDTLRSDRLPAYGYDGVETPAFDALAAEGVVFERAYSPVPLTLPAHASLLTGLLPPDHGVRDNAGYRLADDAGPTVAELLAAEGYATGAAVSSFVMRRETGVARGFDLYDDRFEAGERATISQIQRPGDETLTPALAWLRERSEAGGPFFLFFHIYEPHTPYDPPEPFASRYGSTQEGAYDGEIAASDRIVGDLVQGLRDLGLYDDATVVLLSDHGEGLGDHGEEEHGILLYRESLQVPLIVKLPEGTRAGERVAAPVQLTDVTAALLELAGAPAPEGLAGHSLLGFLGGGAPEGVEADARALYAETFHPHLRFGWSALTSVVRGRHHYIEGADRELYDLVADPAERNDLVREDRRAYAELRDALAGFEGELEPPFQEGSETREALAALGYLGGGAGETEGPPVDPKERLDDLRTLRRGVDLLQAGETQEALPMLERSAEAIPRSIDAWQFLGLAYQRTGRLAEAMDAYERAFDLSNGSPLLAEPMARIALQLQRWDDASTFLGLALEQEPGAVELRMLRARSLLLAGRPGDALPEAQEAADRAPENPDALYLLGAAQMGTNRLEEAEASFRRALDRAPDHRPALSDLAVLLRGTGRQAEARELIERLRALGGGPS
ncbi:MAG: sulfatase-like hydrolase/transferase [Thermoanaerobaculia bacterium]